MLPGLITAIRTLTRIPVPGTTTDQPGKAFPWFPIVGVLLGLILGGMGFLLNAWPAGAAIVIITAEAILTRYLHLDGLADWADGFGVLGDRERTLQVMKDPNTGAFGVVVLILNLLTKWIALTKLCTLGSLSWVPAALALSRAMQVELAVTLPYARPQGGTGRVWVEDAQAHHRWLALGIATLIVFVLQQWIGLLIALGAWIATRLLAYRYQQRIGGITGDLLGATNELIETGVLFAAAAISITLQA